MASGADDLAKKKKGATRKASYSDEECVVITRAMIAAKNDPIRGSGQTRQNLLVTFQRKYQQLAHKDFTDRSQFVFSCRKVQGNLP